MMLREAQGSCAMELTFDAGTSASPAEGRRMPGMTPTNDATGDPDRDYQDVWPGVRP